MLTESFSAIYRYKWAVQGCFSLGIRLENMGWDIAFSASGIYNDYNKSLFRKVYPGSSCWVLCVLVYASIERLEGYLIEKRSKKGFICQGADEEEAHFL